ncbi:hypothetical protein ACJX0J_020997, partial [Zea mays]
GGLGGLEEGHYAAYIKGTPDEFMTDEDVAMFNGMKEAVSDNKCATLFYAFPYLRIDMVHFSMHFPVGLFISLFFGIYYYNQALDFRLWSTLLLCYTCGPKIP